jgi:DNA primase large subunit
MKRDSLVLTLDVERLSSRPEPSIIIFEDTLDAEQEVRKMIDDSLRSFHMSALAPTDETIKRKASIAIKSTVQLVAEDIARSSESELTKTILLRREYLTEAAQVVLQNALATPLGPFELLHDWQNSVTKFLKAELDTLSKRESVFRTCERFKMDLRDFQVVFPKLP